MPDRATDTQQAAPPLVGRAEDAERLVRLVQEVAPPADVPGWLAAHPAVPQSYWADREGAVEVAALGAADVCSGMPEQVFPALRERLERYAGARYYGGMRFDPARPVAEAWQPFGRARFVLPRFELRKERKEEGRTTLACNLLLPRDAPRVEALRAEAEALAKMEPLAAGRLPPAVHRRDVPDRSGWAARVRWALEAMAASSEGRLEKLVLARRTMFDLAGPLDPLALLAALRAATPGCYHFLVRPEAGVAFVGASPERLFRVEGRKLETEAVAGTGRRAERAAPDEALRARLLESDKDRREHEAVRRSLREHLEALCSTTLAEGKPTDLPLARGRHLYARLGGTLRPATTPLDVLRRLHPTPAVGGRPRPEALRVLRCKEPFDRGWYAGPVGWVEAEAAAFAVAIRSGLVRAAALSLYAGGGLVPGSVPEAEWAEVEQKIGDFAAVLDLDAPY